jgi:hypothetical protein
MQAARAIVRREKLPLNIPELPCGARGFRWPLQGCRATREASAVRFRATMRRERSPLTVSELPCDARGFRWPFQGCRATREASADLFRATMRRERPPLTVLGLPCGARGFRGHFRVPFPRPSSQYWAKKRATYQLSCYLCQKHTGNATCHTLPQLRSPKRAAR